MPVYDFRCDGGHEQELLFPMSDRPDDVECKDCGGTAKRTLEQTPLVRTNRSHTWGKAIPASADRERLYLFRCEKGHDTDEWFATAPDVSPCEEEGCELDAKRVRASMTATWWLRKELEGGYYDQGLGRQIRNEAHRREVMKELGVVAVDGDFDQDEVMRPGVEAERTSAVHFNDYYQRVQHAPEYRDFRRAVGQGRVDALPEPDLEEYFDS